MQCDEVIRELATPTDNHDSTALAGHIAGCPACAGWANRAVQLDRLWEATRPPEPTPDVWDAVWVRMATSLDPSTSTEVGSSFTTRTAASTNGSPVVVKLPPKGPRHSPRSRPWRLVAIGLVGLAQAAAILLAVGLAWHQSGSSQPPQIARHTDSTPSPSNSDSVVHIAIPAEGFPVVVDEGHLVVIHEGKQEHKVLLPIFLANLSMLVIHADGQAPKVVDQTPRRILATSGSQGLATGVSTGTSTIIATLNGITGSTVLTVSAAVLQSIAVTPANDVQWWKKAPKVKDQAHEAGPLFGVDDWYVMYNAMESMTSPMVAMKE